MIQLFPLFLKAFQQDKVLSKFMNDWVFQLREKLEQIELSPEQIDRLPESMDLVVSGGGSFCIYAIGVGLVLKAIEKKYQKCHIDRMSGASFGAFLLPLLRCCDNEHAFKRWLINSYAHSYFCVSYYVFSFHQTLKIVIESCLQKTPFPAKLYMSTTELTPFPKNLILSGFESEEQLCSAILHSCAIPSCTTSGLFVNSDGGKWYLDGGFTNNLPVFASTGKHQLIVNISKLARSKEFSYGSFLSSGMEMTKRLTERGIDDMIYFLKTRKRDDCQILKLIR